MDHQTPEDLLNDDECKAIITKLGKKLCLRASLITTRLLSADDKQDMRQGELPVGALEAHIAVWLSNGMPDYANGRDIPLRLER